MSKTQLIFHERKGKERRMKRERKIGKERRMNRERERGKKREK